VFGADDREITSTLGVLTGISEDPGQAEVLREHFNAQST
jgi:hypothetical protein